MFWRSICWVVLVLCTAGKASGQEFQFEHFNLEQGLPHTEITTIYEDAKGYLWLMSNGGGISRFDGEQFVNFDMNDGLPHNIVRAATEDRQHRMWFGTMGKGIVTFDGQSFVPLTDTVLQNALLIYDLVTDLEGNIWVGANDGVYRFDGTTWKHFSEEEGFPQTSTIALLVDTEGGLWAGIDAYGVVRYLDGQIKTYATAEGLTNLSTQAIYERAGQIWIGNFNGCTRIDLPSGKLTNFTPGDEFPAQFVFDFAEDHNGRLWIGTQSKGMGYFVPKEGRFKFLGEGNGLPSSLAFRVFKDSEDQLWVSFWGNGISRFKGMEFAKYDESDGLHSKVVTTVVETPNRGLLIGGAGLNVLVEDSMRSWLAQEVQGTLNTLMYDSKKRLWGATDQYLFLYEQGQFQSWESADGVGLTFIRGICEDPLGNIWFASWNQGLSRFDGRKFERVDANGTMDAENFYTAHADPGGNLWFGSWGGGAVNYDGKEFKSFSWNEGLLSEKVSCIENGNGRAAWFGTYGEGLAYFDGEAFAMITTEDGLSHNTVLDLELNLGFLYISTIAGLDRIDLAEYHEHGKLVIENFGKHHGLKHQPFLNSLYSDGILLWIGTKGGLYRFDPTKNFPERSAPSCDLTGLQLFFEDVDWTAFGAVDQASGLPVDLILPADKNRLTFQFSAIQLNRQYPVHFEYQLQGLDEQWAPPTAQGEVTYHDLAPGAYTFKVRAKSGELFSDEQVFSFTILSPIWQRWWFIGSVALLLLLGFYGFVKIRERNLQRIRQMLEHKVQKRTRRIERQKEIIEARNKDITDSIRYAQRIQEAILPPMETVRAWLPDSFVLYKPKDIVSGDFYWMHQAGNRTYFAAVDCTGHGVPGAMVSVMGANGLNRCVKEFGLKHPHAILDKLAELVAENFETSNTAVNDGMDLALCCLREEQGQLILEYAGANNPLWVIRKDAEVAEVIRADKQPIGRYEHRKPYTNHEVKLSKGDTIYVFSDGYADQFGGEQQKKLKTKNFRELLLAMQDQPMPRQLHKLDAFFEDWKGELEQLDDVCVIGVRV